MGRKFKNLIKCCLGKLGLLDIYRLVRKNLVLYKVIVCRINYQKQLRRLRKKSRTEKIRVLFIVSEIAKWKEQKLYDAMKASERWEPMVCISDWNRQSESFCSNEEYIGTLKRAEAFFDKLGVRHVNAVRIVDGKRLHLKLSEFNPDIVFYTEQWLPSKWQDPYVVSNIALTFFATYYVGDYFVPEGDCHQLVPRLSYGYFCLNESLCKEYEHSLRFVCHTTQFFPTGHPGLDFFNEADGRVGDKYVIYAPHFSFPNPNVPDFGERLSTFDWNGREILTYAKLHSEMNWVFKPHPLLREWILSSGYMTKEGLDEYYSAWGEIGLVCEDGDYQELFLQSRVMITDCGSFLTEYGATGNAVIHLICSDNKWKPIDAVKEVWDSYYKVRNLEELYSTFRQILELRADPNKVKRVNAVTKAGIRNCCASERITECLEGLICGK